MQSLVSKQLVEHIQSNTKNLVANLIDHGTNPQLAVILVGDNPDSVKYVDRKVKASKECGIIVSVYRLPAASSFKEIEDVLKYLAADNDVHGIIIQLPLPSQVSPDETTVFLEMIPDSKDVDGLKGEWRNLAITSLKLVDLEKPSGAFLPPTPLSVLSLLDWYDISLDDKEVVTVGNGRLVGYPMTEILKKAGIKARSVNDETQDIISITSQADVLITGTGQKDLVTYQWVKEGAVVINCAMDVHEDSVSQVASAMSPAIGGIGPLTVAWLLYNVAQAAYKQSKA